MKIISKKAYLEAEKQMNNMLSFADKEGGFSKLTKKENAELKKYTDIVVAYEDKQYPIPLPAQIAMQKKYKDEIEKREENKMSKEEEMKLIGEAIREHKEENKNEPKYELIMTTKKEFNRDLKKEIVPVKKKKFGMTITLTEDQVKEFKKWQKSFGELPYIGAIGGHFGISIIFTSIDDIITGIAWNGEEIYLGVVE